MVLANIEEVKGRGGRVIAIANAGDDELDQLADAVLHVPETLPMLSPIITTIPLQPIAYHAAVARGHDVDKPRNLAKGNVSFPTGAVVGFCSSVFAPVSPKFAGCFRHCLSTA